MSDGLDLSFFAFIAEHNEIRDLVNSFFKDNKKTILWMKTENPMLGNQVPNYMIKIGRFEKLKQFVETMLDENKREDKNDN